MVVSLQSIIISIVADDLLMLWILKPKPPTTTYHRLRRRHWKNWRNDKTSSSNPLTKVGPLSSGPVPYTSRRHFVNYWTVVFMIALTVFLLRNTRTRLRLPWRIWSWKTNFHLQQKILSSTHPVLLVSIYFRKSNNPGRPIVSACNCPTENIAAYLDEVMSPLVANLASFVKDTNHTLEIFNTFDFNNSNPDQRFLFTMDVKSLYTVIPNDWGLQALAHFLDKRPVLEPPTSTLTCLAELTSSHAECVKWALITPVFSLDIWRSECCPPTQDTFLHYISGILTMSLEQPCVIEGNWRISSTMFQTSIPLYNSHTPSHKLSYLSWTSNSAHLAVKLQHLFTTKKPTPTTTFTTPLLTLSTVKTASRTASFYASAVSALMTVTLQKYQVHLHVNTPGAAPANTPRLTSMYAGQRVQPPSANTTYKSENMVYCISCRQCPLLYIGETGWSLRERFGEHQKKTPGFPVAKHFNSASHTLSDIMIRGLRMCTGTSLRRKQQEMEIIFRLGTTQPQGLNNAFHFL